MTERSHDRDDPSGNGSLGTRNIFTFLSARHHTFYSLFPLRVLTSFVSLVPDSRRRSFVWTFRVLLSPGPLPLPTFLRRLSSTPLNQTQERGTQGKILLSILSATVSGNGRDGTRHVDGDGGTGRGGIRHKGGRPLSEKVTSRRSEGTR